MSTNIDETSTHEDIEAAVEEIVADRIGEEPSDDQTETITDESDDQNIEEDTATEEGSEDTGEETLEAEEVETDWLDDDTKAEIAAYGISEDEIADYTSREELDRALRFLDKNALDIGRKDKPDEVHNEQTQEVQKTSETYEVQLDKDVYDEAIVNEFTRMRDHYESRLKAFESSVEAMNQRFAETDAIAEQKIFDNLVDSLGHADLFGKTGNESKKERGRRDQLYSDLYAFVTGLESRGVQPDINEALLKKVVRMTFPDEHDKKVIKNHTRKVTKQSNSRQGGGATRATDSKEDPRDEAERLYKEMVGS